MLFALDSYHAVLCFKGLKFMVMLQWIHYQHFCVLSNSNMETTIIQCQHRFMLDTFQKNQPCYVKYISEKSTMSTRVYVGRISNDTREKDLERFFKGYGRLREVMMKNGYSFVVSRFVVEFFTTASDLYFKQ